MGRTSVVQWVWVLAMLGCLGAPEQNTANAELGSVEAPASAPATSTPAEEPLAAEPAALARLDLQEEAEQTAVIDDLLAGALGGSSGHAANDEALHEARARPRRRRSSTMHAGAPGRSRGRLVDDWDSNTTSTHAAAPAAALPQNGVLASTFVGGNGASARLDDLLDRGVMVSGERIRLQAFEDREPLPYPRPAHDAVDMFAELERTRLNSGGDRVHLQIALIGREGEAPVRPSMDVRLVLDRSGSMNDGSKWEHAKAAAHALVDRLEPNDHFALVSYSDDARLDIPARRVGNGVSAHSTINTIQPGGGTNIEAGLLMAASNPPRRGARDLGMVILISDGQATIGQTAPSELAAIARRTFDDHGVLTTAIGLGTDFDERTMLEIAREGSGSYHFVRRSQDVEQVLQDELEDRAQAVAQALRVRIELADGVTARRVYGSRMLGEAEHAAVRNTERTTDARIARELGVTQNRRQEEERGLRVHLPTFRRGDQHVILMELDVPRGTSTADIATVTLDYKDLVRERNGQVVRQVTAECSRDADAIVSSIRRPVKRTVLAFQAGEALQNAASALTRGDSSNARRLLSEQRELLEAAASLWRDPALGVDAQRLARYERVLGGAWDGWGQGEQRTLVMAMNFFGDRRMR
jgi:Mg-chelatase subunit ChlD